MEHLLDENSNIDFVVRKMSESVTRNDLDRGKQVYFRNSVYQTGFSY